MGNPWRRILGPQAQPLTKESGAEGRGGPGTGPDPPPPGPASAQRRLRRPHPAQAGGEAPAHLAAALLRVMGFSESDCRVGVSLGKLGTACRPRAEPVPTQPFPGRRRVGAGHTHCFLCFRKPRGKGKSYEQKGCCAASGLTDGGEGWDACRLPGSRDRDRDQGIQPAGPGPSWSWRGAGTVSVCLFPLPLCPQEKRASG